MHGFSETGFINRNTILSNGAPLRITLPVPGASSNTLIKDLVLQSDGQDHEDRAPGVLEGAVLRGGIPIVTNVIESRCRSIVDVCRKSIVEVFRYLDLTTNVILASGLEYDRHSRRTKSFRYAEPSDRRSTSTASEAGSSTPRHHLSRRGAIAFIEMDDVRYRQRSASSSRTYP